MRRRFMGGNDPYQIDFKGKIKSPDSNDYGQFYINDKIDITLGKKTVSSTIITIYTLQFDKPKNGTICSGSISFYITGDLHTYVISCSKVIIKVGDDSFETALPNSTANMVQIYPNSIPVSVWDTIKNNSQSGLYTPIRMNFKK